MRIEEREERVNEAEAYYAGKLLAVAGERAIRLLNGAAPDAGKRSDQSTTGGLSNWTLTDDLWGQLGRESPTTPMALSGEAGSILSAARQAATKTTQAARGEAARFNELVSAYQAQPRLTGSELYWQAIVDSLSNRPLVVVDPKAGGHKRLFLGGPDELRAGALLQDSETQPSTGREQPPGVCLSRLPPTRRQPIGRCRSGLRSPNRNSFGRTRKP